MKMITNRRRNTFIPRPRLYVYFVFVLFVISCNPEEIGPQYEEQDGDMPFNTEIEQGVYIINEGNFNFGNSSLSFYNPSSNTVSNLVYQSENDGSELGDVFQSMYVSDSTYFLVINNSGKTVLTNPELIHQSEIIGLTSPRHFLRTSDDKAYVSDLYAEEITILDLSNNSISGNISTGAWIEKMKIVDNRVWAANKTDDKILILNPELDTVEDEISLSAGTGNMVEDALGRIWILCGGTWSGDELAILYCIDKSTLEIIDEFTFSEDESPSLLRIDGEGEYLFFHQEGIKMMSISATFLPEETLIDTEDYSVYGLDVNPSNGDVYICDAIDYVQAGSVHRYSEDGELMDSFSVGQIPRECVFVSE